jgi:hypothetical protein
VGGAPVEPVPTVPALGSLNSPIFFLCECGRLGAVRPPLFMFNRVPSPVLRIPIEVFATVAAARPSIVLHPTIPPINVSSNKRRRASAGATHGPNMKNISEPKPATAQPRPNTKQMINAMARRSQPNSQRNYERYLVLARAEALSGDRIAAENYFQHAEHYLRSMQENAN